MRFGDVTLLGMCVAWLVALFFIVEPNPVVDWRVVAAFVQAILSGGAIYTAWWLQGRKREADRREAERDTLHTALYVIAQAEWTTVGLLNLRKKDSLHRANALAAVEGLERSNEMLRRLNFGHFEDETRLDVLTIIETYGQIAAFLSARLQKDDSENVIMGPVYVSLYNSAFNAMNELLKRHSFRLRNRRVEPVNLSRTGDPGDVFDGTRRAYTFDD